MATWGRRGGRAISWGDLGEGPDLDPSWCRAPRGERGEMGTRGPPSRHPVTGDGGDVGWDWAAPQRGRGPYSRVLFGSG